MIPLRRHVARTADTGALIAPVVAAADSAALMLDERGMICDCDRSAESLFGYRRSEMVWRHVSMLLPQLQQVELLEDGQVNSRIRFLSQLDGYFHAVDRLGKRFGVDLFLVELGNPGLPRLRLIVRGGDAQ